MNIRKDFFRIFSYIVIMLFSSCTTRDEFSVPEGGESSPFIIAGIVESDDRSLKARVGMNVDFIDGTVNSIEREWVFPEGSVEFVEGDVLSKKIIVKFLKEGEFDVLLNSGGQESTEKVTVLAMVRGTFTVESTDGDNSVFKFNKQNKELIVEAGSELQFFEQTQGDLENFIWKFIGQSPAVFDEPNPTVVFNKLGDFGYNFRGSSALPNGNLRLPSFPLNGEERFFRYRVIPSSKPLLLDSVEEDENAAIVLSFSRALDPSTLESIDNFTLKVDGMDASIKEVKVDPVNTQNVLVVPDVDILNTQTATLSYTVESITSADGVKAEIASLMDEEVIVYDPNLIEKDVTFESGILEWAIDSSSMDASGVEVSLVSPGNESDTALNISNFKTGNNFVIGLRDALNVKDGQQLQLEFDYKIPADFNGNTPLTFRLYEDGVFSNAFRVFNNSGCCGLIANGEWNRLSKPFLDTISGDFRSGLYLQIISRGDTPSNVLIDNIAIKIVE